MPVNPLLYEVAWIKGDAEELRSKLGEPHFTRTRSSQFSFVDYDIGDYWAFISEKEQRFLLFMPRMRDRLRVFVYPWDTPAALSERAFLLEHATACVDHEPNMLT